MNSKIIAISTMCVFIGIMLYLIITSTAKDTQQRTLKTEQPKQKEFVILLQDKVLSGHGYRLLLVNDSFLVFSSERGLLLLGKTHEYTRTK